MLLINSAGRLAGRSVNKILARLNLFLITLLLSVVPSTWALDFADGAHHTVDYAVPVDGIHVHQRPSDGATTTVDIVAPALIDDAPSAPTFIAPISLDTTLTAEGGAEERRS